MSRVLLAAALAGALVFAASAAAEGFTIHGDWKLGSFLVKRDGTLRGAVDAFGQPGSKVRNGEICTVRWRRHGLRIIFYNLGGQNPCRGQFGFFANARISGADWVTDRGLAIGDRRHRLRDLYPRAAFHSAVPGCCPSGWWLVRRHSVFGTGGAYPGLLAHMQDRRVASFRVTFPAGGD